MRRVRGGFREPARNFGVSEKAITYHLKFDIVEGAKGPAANYKPLSNLDKKALLFQQGFFLTSTLLFIYINKYVNENASR